MVPGWVWSGVKLAESVVMLNDGVDPLSNACFTPTCDLDHATLVAGFSTEIVCE